MPLDLSVTAATRPRAYDSRRGAHRQVLGRKCGDETLVRREKHIRRRAVSNLLRQHAGRAEHQRHVDSSFSLELRNDQFERRAEVGAANTRIGAVWARARIVMTPLSTADHQETQRLSRDS